jgi:hypothetical protein
MRLGAQTKHAFVKWGGEIHGKPDPPAAAAGLIHTVDPSVHHCSNYSLASLRHSCLENLGVIGLNFESRAGKKVLTIPSIAPQFVPDRTFVPLLLQ